MAIVLYSQSILRVFLYSLHLCVCNSNSVSSIKMTSPFFCSQRVPPVNRSLSSPTSSSIAQVDPPRDPSRIVGSAVDREQVYSWILELTNPETREHAFIELRYWLTIYMYMYGCMHICNFKFSLSVQSNIYI